MPRSVNTEVLNSFGGGFVTEATALNFPQNGCTEVDNCIFDINGGIYRRPGLAFETGYTTATDTRTDKAINSFLWQNPAGQANKNLLVVQVGGVLHFYDTHNSAVSTGKLSSTIDFTSFATSTTALVLANDCQFTFGQGKLVVVHPYCKSFYVTFDPTGNTVAATGIDIKIRDTIGVTDETGTVYDTRPVILTSLHQYNIYNQGWKPTSTKNYVTAWRSTVTRTDVVYIGNDAFGNPRFWPTTVTVATGRSDYPSNADVWWVMKNASNVFDINLADDGTRGNTPAPKGYFILDAFNQDRSTASGISGITTVTSDVYRPSTCAFFSGRVFYSGVNTSNFSNKVYFSQVATDADKFGKCYQLNDPTNENLFDLLATDGGVIEIADCGQIIKLFAIQNTLLVFATNGVWVITGNQNLGFTASDFSVRKASSIPALSGSSFVDIDGLPCWWNNDGIYQLSGLNAAGMAQIDNIAFSSIRTFYNGSISNSAKKYAKGAYDPMRKDVFWFYRSTAGTTTQENYEQDRALAFNFSTKAYSLWSFPNTSTKILGASRVPINGSLGTNKYLVATGSSITFAEMNGTDYTDFGTTYESSFLTGYKISGGVIKKFQNNYIQLITDWEDETQFNIQGVWNFATSGDTAYYQTKQLIQFPPVPRNYNKRKIKIRGNGNALQLRVSSVDGKPFNIAGWVVYVTSNQSI